jgi:hypothetical protein
MTCGQALGAAYSPGLRGLSQVPLALEPGRGSGRILPDRSRKDVRETHDLIHKNGRPYYFRE